MIIDNGEWILIYQGCKTMGNNAVKDKSFEFAISIIRLYKLLIEEKEFILSKQLLRSGTAIGALVREAEQAESKKDFIHKMSIGLKEATETEYWIDLLENGKFLKENQFQEIKTKSIELIKLLTSIIKSSKANN